jgi:hypothetical protein
MLRVRVRSAVTLTIFLSLTGCDTPSAVSTFCGTATTTLSSASTVLADIRGSCLREVNTNRVIGSFTLPVTSDPNCALVGTQGDAAIAAAKLLAEYFSTINSLATIGTAKTSADANTLAANTAGVFAVGSAETTAVGSIAQDLTSGIMNVYQTRKLAQDLPKASSDVTAITNALITIIQTNYINQELANEEKKIANPYKTFLLAHNSPEVTLTLEGNWQADEQNLQARRVAANSAVTALQTLSKGFADLANNARTLKAKELSGLLEPYVTQMQTLVPQIQKAF